MIDPGHLGEVVEHRLVQAAVAGEHRSAREAERLAGQVVLFSVLALGVAGWFFFWLRASALCGSTPSELPSR